MVIELVENGLKGVSGIVVYPKELGNSNTTLRELVNP